jgi:hypothetical protein
MISVKRLKFRRLTELFDQLPNPSVLFWQLIESSNNGILGFKKVLINCQKRTGGFWQLIETF